MRGPAYATVSDATGTGGAAGSGRVVSDSNQAALLRLPRAVLAVHIATLVAGFGVWMYLDRHLWFYGDEWDFIVLRGVFHAQVSIWAPHNEHWSTLPILAWRALFSIVHLAHYWPYLVLLLLVHVLVVHLVWRRCLREAVDPWLATGLGLLVALLGTAAEDLTWAFQIGFLGSLAFGLIALELLEARRRTPVTAAGASLAAIASLMCSDIGVAMLASFAILALARLGWRGATVVVAPAAGAFVTWFALIGHTGVASDPITRAILLGLPRFAWHDIRTDLSRIFDLPAVLAFVAPVLIGGIVVWLAWGGRRLFHQHPVVVALVAGDVVFHVLTAVGRERLGQAFSPSRYVYIDAVFLLPVLAVALCWRPGLTRARLVPGVRGLAVVVLAACTVGNTLQGVTFVRAHTSYVLMLKQEIVGGAQLLARGQRAIAAHPIRYAGLTPRGMLSMERQHLLPKLDMTPADLYTDETVLDVTMASRRLVPGEFALLGASQGVVVRTAGPGCIATRSGRRARSPLLVWRLTPGSRSAALHFAGVADKLRAFLDPGRAPLAHQVSAALGVPGHGGWLSDAVPKDNLVLEVPTGLSTFCDVSTGSPISGPA